jgi:predicted transcriptional regulator
MVERLEDQVEKEKRDIEILRVVIEQGPIGIVRIAEETDLPEHKVRYSLRMLENDGLIDPTESGAVPDENLSDQLAGHNEDIDRLIERLQDMKELF